MAAPALKKLAEEADQRLADCRRQKADVELDLQEGYFFTRPRLARQVQSRAPSSARVKDQDELATGIGSEVAEDFATEVINAFMPPHYNWCRSEAGEGVPEEAWDAVKDEAERIDGEVFRAIRASNFDAELATALVPDGALGTVALWIDERRPHEPLFVQHVPLRELEINVGPEGGVDDRFVVRHVRPGKVRACLRGIELPPKLERELGRKRPGEWVELRWGYWRDWNEPDDIVWQGVVQVAGEVVASPVHRGEGTCPLIVGRFSPDTLHAYGNGPTLDCLPFLRIHDAMSEGTQDRIDIAISPPFAYPDDGVMSFEGGIRSGMAYPMRPGSGSIQPLYFEGNPDLGFYQIADLERMIRRKHFADYPEQRGDTPPTATQWLDEMVKAQRRIGTPGQKFWKELPAEVFLRFRHLLTARGVVRPLTADGRSIATRPYNPATKAQEQQEVQVADRLLVMAKSYFPMTAQAAIDELETLRALKEKMGDKIVMLRPAEEVGRMVQQILGAAAEAMGGGG